MFITLKHISTLTANITTFQGSEGGTGFRQDITNAGSDLDLVPLVLTMCVMDSFLVYNQIALMCL